MINNNRGRLEMPSEAAPNTQNYHNRLPSVLPNAEFTSLIEEAMFLTKKNSVNMDIPEQLRRESQLNYQLIINTLSAKFRGDGLCN